MTGTKAKFGVLLPTLTSTFDLISSAAKVAEENGFASVWCMDHLICEPEFYRLLNVKPSSFKLLEAWTTLTAVAVQTQRLMLGTAVSPMPRYNPTFLAKVVTTLEIKQHGAYGSPESIIDQIEEFMGAGVKHFVLVLVPQKDTVKSIKLYGEKVLTQVHVQ